LQPVAECLPVFLAGVRGGVLASILEQRRILTTQPLDLGTSLGEDDVDCGRTGDHFLLHAHRGRSLGQFAPYAFLKPQQRVKLAIREETPDVDVAVWTAVSVNSAVALH